MIVRFLTRNDVVEHDKVTSQAFSYACDINDPSSVLPCPNVLGAFDGDNKTLLADFEINERKCNYDGGILTCAAVGGVAAKPEHRGKGAVKALFRYLFEQTDYDISILYPFSETYYRNFGYERAGYSVCATIPFSEISGIGRNHDVTLYEGNSTEQLLALYNKCARQYSLSFVRENAEAFSGEPYLSKSYTYIWKNNAFATIGIDRENSVILVKELYFDSCESMQGIIGFLRNFESNQKSICFQNIPVSSPLLGFLRDMKNCDIKMYNTGSVRILNVEKVLRAHQYPAREGAFTLRIDDDTFKVTVSANGVETEKNNALEPDAIMDISTASQLLLCGFSQAEYIPRLTVRNPQSDFFRLFPPRSVFFSDCF